MPAEPVQIPQPSNYEPPPASLSIPQPTSTRRSGHLNLDTFSPVNQNGSFEFDRVLKSGQVYKRTRKTKASLNYFSHLFYKPELIFLQQWKGCYLVLRPNLLSVYKNASEERLHKQISLSDLTAATYLKDSKGRRDNVFGLFSPPRNFYFQANDQQDARSWLELIKREARIDEVEQELLLGSPGPATERGFFRGEENERWDQERLASSSPEPLDFPPRRSTTRDGVSIPGLRRPSANDLDYSGDELGLSSDFSDTAVPQGSINTSINSRSSFQGRKRSGSKPQNQLPISATPGQQTRPGTAGNGSQVSIFPIDQDEERVIWHGYLLCLKSKGGVRQWKKHWAVLRTKNITFYKSQQVTIAYHLLC